MKKIIYVALIFVLLISTTSCVQENEFSISFFLPPIYTSQENEVSISFFLPPKELKEDMSQEDVREITDKHFSDIPKESTLPNLFYNDIEKSYKENKISALVGFVDSKLDFILYSIEMHDIDKINELYKELKLFFDEKFGEENDSEIGNPDSGGTYSLEKQISSDYIFDSMFLFKVEDRIFIAYRLEKPNESEEVKEILDSLDNVTVEFFALPEQLKKTREAKEVKEVLDSLFPIFIADTEYNDGSSHMLFYDTGKLFRDYSIDFGAAFNEEQKNSSLSYFLNLNDDDFKRNYDIYEEIKLFFIKKYGESEMIETIRDVHSEDLFYKDEIDEIEIIEGIKNGDYTESTFWNFFNKDTIDYEDSFLLNVYFSNGNINITYHMIDKSEVSISSSLPPKELEAKISQQNEVSISFFLPPKGLEARMSQEKAKIITDNHFSAIPYEVALPNFFYNDIGKTYKGNEISALVEFVNSKLDSITYGINIDDNYEFYDLFVEFGLFFNEKFGEENDRIIGDPYSESFSLVKQIESV